MQRRYAALDGEIFMLSPPPCAVAHGYKCWKRYALFRDSEEDKCIKIILAVLLLISEKTYNFV